ncbi:hypothetical protein [Nonomuraea rosea]|uniref:hypothetical protein n=1 Tax=Nonomuraea rosea TaxID=638574 RepID=UPI0031EBBA38
MIHLASLTRPAAPSLRIGAVIARGPVLRRLRDMRFVDDFFTGWRLAHRPSGGLHVWAELPPGDQDAAVARAARTAGVAVDAGTRYFPAEPSGPYVRLGFAAAMDPAGFREAVRRLAAMREIRRLAAAARAA